jgi:outer membrane protein OmpA-like peptidoglycan-associated protein
VSDLNADPGANATISGHTAAYGTDAYRHDLSVHRAEAVAQALESSGVAAGRLHAFGYGSTKPAVNEFPNGVHDPAAAAENRRVVIEIMHSGCGS